MNKRLPSSAGEWINRDKVIHFSFEGVDYTGFEGDTITSALWAAGEKVLGRSFKYHRPRGILSLANHDINVLVTDGIDTNIRADIIPISAGMKLTAVNTSGGVKKDKKRWLDLISPMLPVGFYYKAFHSPRKLFPFWENLIRKSAGLGVVNFNLPYQLKRKTHVHYDVLVIGAGASGLSSALESAKNGLNVLLIDENSRAGGSLTYDLASEDKAESQLTDMLEAVQQSNYITLKTGAYAAGYYTNHYLPIVSKEGITKVRAKAVIVATGAFEQPPVFRNNDLPGVMLGSAAQRLINRYRVKPFENGVVFTANHHGYRVALDLLANGIRIAALVDLRQAPAEKLSEQLISSGVVIYTGYCVYEAIANSADSTVNAAVICPFDEPTNTADSVASITIACDGIAMSAGWAGASALLYQAGSKMQYDYTVEQFIPKNMPAGIFAAGKVNGIFDLAERYKDGEHAGKAATDYLHALNTQTNIQTNGPASNSQHTDRQINGTPSHPYPFVPHSKGKNFIDFDEDIQLKDFINAAQEGFDNIELMKRFTTVGMGPSQGKHSNMNAIRILANIRKLPVEKIGSTTARPFFHPTPMGHLAGRSFNPHRLTTLHSLHEGANAEFTQVGAWLRPVYYKKPNLTKTAAVEQEVLAVRNSIGLIDVGTLGKIEIHGADAALFLERFYAGSFISQKIGETRYALALDETGVMMDDGITARLADNLFYVTASTSNAATIYREMQRWQQQWQLDIVLVNVTSAYGAINLAGPAARDVLTKLCPLSLLDQDFPVASVRESTVANIPAKVIRVGFVSELAYEIHIRADKAPTVWQALLAAGSTQNIRPFGTEAQRILRLEMGHPITGHDTDGLTNPYEVGSEFALKMTKPFFVGKRSLQILNKKPFTKKLVAFMLDENVLEKNTAGELPKECNLIIEHNNIVGRVTSIYFSPTLERTIGLAYITPNKAISGEAFDIKTDNGSMVTAHVVKTPFINSSSNLKGVST